MIASPIRRQFKTKPARGGTLHVGETNSMPTPIDYRMAFYRQRKADAITELLLASQCTREMAGAMNDEDWAAIAYWAAVRAPSVATRELVMARLPRFQTRPDAPQSRRCAYPAG